MAETIMSVMMMLILLSVVHVILVNYWRYINMKRLFFSIMVALATVSAVNADVISVNFGYTTLAPGDTAGVVPASNWDTVVFEADTLLYAGTGTDLMALKDDSGTSTTAGISISGTGAKGVINNNSGYGSPDSTMMTEGSRVGADIVTLTFSNIPYAVYDVYLYTLSDYSANNRITKSTIGGTSYFNRSAGTGADTDWNKTGYKVTQNITNSSARGNRSNVSLFEDITGSTFELELSSENANKWGIINGIQIVGYPPCIPVLPDRGEVVSRDTDFVWELIDDLPYTPDKYDVYIDPNFTRTATEDPACEFVATDLTELSFDPSGDLSYDTTYYWSVVAYEPDPNGGEPDPNDAHLCGPWVFYVPSADGYIVTQPPNATADASNVAETTVEAIHASSYQWYSVDSGLLVGQTGATLSLSGFGKADEGQYYCEVTGHSAAVTASDNARLWARREVAHWDFEDTLVDTVDGWNGVYTDPNVNNPAPDPSGSYYYIDDANAVDGKAFDMRAVDYFIVVDSSEEFFNFHPQGYTVNCWVKIDDYGTWELAVSKLTQDQSSGWAVGRYEDQGFLGIRGTDLPTDNYGGTVSYGQNQWHMITSMYDPSTKRYKLFIDGQQVNQSNAVTGSIATGIEALVIGAENIIGNAPLNGIVDEVQVWSYALDPLAVGQLYYDITGQSVCVDSEGLQYDFNDDCYVDLTDFAGIAGEWLDCFLIPASNCI